MSDYQNLVDEYLKENEVTQCEPGATTFVYDVWDPKKHQLVPRDPNKSSWRAKSRNEYSGVRKRQAIKAAKVRRVLELKEQGLRSTEIAEEMGIRQQAVCDYARGAGSPFKHNGGVFARTAANIQNKKLKQKRMAQAVKLTAEGYSSKQVAALMKINKSTVNSYLCEHRRQVAAE